MQIVDVSKIPAGGLPKELISAQQAIDLPEVQEMLARLSEYNLGIFMPHMHEEQSGDFQVLPGGVVQVESGLAVSFQMTEPLATRAARFLPVAWRWQAGASVPVAVCEMAQEGEGEDGDDKVQHKMPSLTQAPAP